MRELGIRANALNIPSIRNTPCFFARVLKSAHSAALSVAGCEYSQCQHAGRAYLLHQAVLAGLENKARVIVVRRSRGTNIHNVGILSTSDISRVSFVLALVRALTGSLTTPA